MNLVLFCGSLDPPFIWQLDHCNFSETNYYLQEELGPNPITLGGRKRRPYRRLNYFAAMRDSFTLFVEICCCNLDNSLPTVPVYFYL